jgi:Flp pilus assembly protein TadG
VITMPEGWRIASDGSGTAAVEFALIAPILFMLMLGIAKCGIIFNNYIMLTEAASAGTRQLALSRGAATPRTTTVNMIRSAATGLAQQNLAITLLVNGTACGADSPCATALASATNTSAVVALSYPCDLVIFGVDFAPGCQLSSTRAQRIE